MLPEKRISFPSQAQGFTCRVAAQFNHAHAPNRRPGFPLRTSVVVVCLFRAPPASPGGGR